MNGPVLTTIRQRFPAVRCDHGPTIVREELHACIAGSGRHGRIALAVGSRGITGIDAIVKAAVEAVRAAGADPFIVPAMGSHGGATAQGQAAILAGYGITAHAMGAPVESSMETVCIGESSLDNRVFMDRAAFEADGVVLINRIKPHTDFHGDHESGLVKMGVVGLGKHEAALELHAYGVPGLRDHIPASFRTVITTGKLLAGIAIIENAYDETAAVEIIPGAAIMSREPELLVRAKKNMPSLPVEEIDVLIVDRLGKDISGTGMDPNIIGRMRIRGQKEPEAPRIKTIVVTDLTPGSHGNALGIGLADIITRNLFDKIDFEAMRVNVRASLFLERVKVPFIAANPADAIDLALRACGRIAAGKERIVRIRDTLHLGTVQVSGAVLDEIRDCVEIVRGPESVLAGSGELLDW